MIESDSFLVVLDPILKADLLEPFSLLVELFEGLPDLFIAIEHELSQQNKVSANTEHTSRHEWSGLILILPSLTFRAQ